MTRYKCVISYDGSGFYGYQVQPNKRTVQSELEAVLAKMHKGKHVKVYGSGRTDAGVHAMGQVIHFDSPLSIPEEKWPVALNSLLPDDMAIKSVKQVSPSFHARFDAQGKEYRYFLHLSATRDPFKRNFAYQYPFNIDIRRMQEASVYLLGTHDFTSFCSAKTEIEDKIRTIHELEITAEDELVTFRFVGTGFLYNMVRILVGTLLMVGTGELNPADVESILAKKDRRCAGKTAPAQGLYLWKVFYE